MKEQLKLAILGGTGKSGKYLVKELLTRGYCLKLLLRNPENLRLKRPGIEIVKGDARNYEAVLSLVQGCQAVISTLVNREARRLYSVKPQLISYGQCLTTMSTAIYLQLD